MSLKSRFSSIITLAFAVGAFGVGASAQVTAPAPKDDSQKIEKRERGFGRHGERGLRGDKFGRRGGMERGGFGLRGIELTDAQKEQIRQIREANKVSESLMSEIKSIREARRGGTDLTAAQKERMKAIREEMRTKKESVRTQILNVLTAEQRQQLESRKAEMEKRREEMRLKRQELRQKREGTKSTDDN